MPCTFYLYRNYSSPAPVLHKCVRRTFVGMCVGTCMALCVRHQVDIPHITTVHTVQCTYLYCTLYGH